MTKPEIWHFGRVSSALDVAAKLAASRRFGIWDSILAQSQSAGRGQMRRNWFSPEGNIYAALRLPLEGPFASQAAAPAMGCLLALAFAQLDFNVKIKWPNDIVCFGAFEKPVKIAGILLEERAGCLFAGVGVNVCQAPSKSMLRENAALEAASLAEIAPNFLSHYQSFDFLWSSLVKCVFSIYKTKDFVRDWQMLANNFLLWRNQSVLIKDGNQAVRGRLQGLSLTGELILASNGTTQLCHSGSLALAD